mgnify:FL=1
MTTIDTFISIIGLNPHNMAMGKTTANLLMVLVLILAGAGMLVAYQEGLFTTSGTERSYTNKSPVNSGYQVVVANTTNPSKRQIVTDRYVGELQEDGKIVAIGESGEAYAVRKGVVLADGMLIEANGT